MKQLVIHLFSLILGSFFGSLSARMLMQQATIDVVKPIFSVRFNSMLRLGTLCLAGWYLLHWGPVPLILFGGSLLITMWIVIVAFNY